MPDLGWTRYNEDRENAAWLNFLVELRSELQYLEDESEEFIAGKARDLRLEIESLLKNAEQ